ncbi:hypothetical protein [Pandoraea sp. NPDC087047]|uniref:hypothetical protein n=1 Tax=Pandoraea sp. NPDC087047 TaxID=3364390 RepID=UPI003816CE7E
MLANPSPQALHSLNSLFPDAALKHLMNLLLSRLYPMKGLPTGSAPHILLTLNAQDDTAAHKINCRNRTVIRVTPTGLSAVPEWHPL